MAYSWGWSEKKFFKSVPEYFFKVWKGKRDEADRFERQNWERLRVLGAWVYASQGSKGITAKKLLPLPWDKVMTKEQFLKDNKNLIPIWDKLSK